MTAQEKIASAKARKMRREEKRAENLELSSNLSSKPIKNPRKPKKLTKSRLKAQIDKLTSQIVQKRDMAVYGGWCLICMTKRSLGLLERAPEPITLAYHIVPRGDLMTRWNLANIAGACLRCNFAEKRSRERESSRQKYETIHAALIGLDKLDELKKLAAQTSHFTTADLIELRDSMSERLRGTN